MKNLIIATALAVTSIFAFAPSSYAQGASVTITTGDGPRYHRNDDRPRYYRERPRHVRDWQRPRQRCMTKKVSTYRNGHRVTKTTQVCR
jgi:Ni/Co efflux regulator RcnB